jgi:hypothetical protein
MISLSDNPSVERYFDLCKDMQVLAEIASNTLDHYMKLKNHIKMLTKQFSSSSCEHSPHSQALRGASTTCNLSINAMADKKVIRC